MIRSRIVFCIWTLALLLLFFYKGQPAVTVLLIFTAAYALAAFLLTHRRGREISIGFTGGDMVSKGETVTMNMELKNRGKLPVFSCTCEAVARNLLTGTEDKHIVSLSLPPGGSRSFRFDLTESCCGKVELRAQKLTVSDPLRLFAAERPAGETGRMVLRPSVTSRRSCIRRISRRSSWIRITWRAISIPSTRREAIRARCSGSANTRRGTA